MAYTDDAVYELILWHLRVQSWFWYQFLSILSFKHVCILQALFYSMSMQVSVIIHNCRN